MDLNTKKQCVAQLEGLAKTLGGVDGHDADGVILDICASLMAIVDAAPSVSSLDEDEFDERMDNHMSIYLSMKKFMTEAKDMLPLSRAQTELAACQNLYEEEKKKLDEISKKCEEIDRRAQDTRNKTKQKEQQIEKLYEKQGEAFKLYVETTQKLSELEAMSAEFEPDKLEELLKRKESLEEHTRTLGERYRVINEETAECLEQLSEALRKMGAVLDEHSEKAEKTRRDADEFRARVEAYTEVYREYRDWFDVEQTPMQAFEAMVGAEEAGQLKGVLTKNDLMRKNQLVKRIDQDLSSLSKLVNACTKAAQMDHQYINNKAKS